MQKGGLVLCGAVVMAAVVACSPSEQAGPGVTKPQGPVAKANLAQWKSALDAVRQRTNERAGGEGVTDYEVCVGKADDRCGLKLPARYDASPIPFNPAPILLRCERIFGLPMARAMSV